MADNRFNSLNDYEQLKRRNRRRLVGASVMVLLAGLLLAKVLNQGGGNQEGAQSISIHDASGVQTASETDAPQVLVNNQAASADDASDLSPSAVLEPAPEGNTHATVLDNPLAVGGAQTVQEEPPAADPDKVFETAVVNEPVENETPAATPQSAAEPKPAAPAARENTTATPPPVVLINNNRAADKQTAEKAAAEKAAAEKAAAERKAEQQRAADARKREAAAKAAEQQKAQQAKQQAAREQAKKQAGEAAKKQQQAAAQRNPQDILNNKAAQPQAAAKADPQAILDGRGGAAATSGGKAIIQAGAYSNREQAAQIRQKLADAGVSAYISEAETSKGTVYRVRTGSYASRNAANQALAKIRQQGVDGIVIGQ
ncbi:MAG: SPOR domain-containing protein [Neisseria sp.]|nr:SPOR domain-containing protein [Neisseria sp.]